MPYIQGAMGLSNLQFGALAAILSISAGIANIPAGFLVDMARSRWGQILTACMVLAAVGYGLVAASPGFLFLSFAFLLLALPGTIWHMPAIAAISQRFPQRRGYGLSIHGVGGQIGDSIGPLVVGGLLTLFTFLWRRVNPVDLWRWVALVYVFPAVLMTGVVWWALFRLGGSGDDSGPGTRLSLGQRFRDAGRLLRNPAILSLVLVSSLRDMGSGSLVIWLPKYLLDPVEAGGLAMTPLLVGLHLTLLLILGVVSSPIAGILSDRYGRKLILIPCLTAVGLLSLVLGQVEAGPVEKKSKNNHR
jgi:MFS family permease